MQIFCRIIEFLLYISSVKVKCAVAYLAKFPYGVPFGGRAGKINIAQGVATEYHIVSKFSYARRQRNAFECRAISECALPDGSNALGDDYVCELFTLVEGRIADSSKR